MTIREIFGRGWVRCLGLAGIAATGYVAGLMTDRVAAQQIAAPPLPTADKRIVAYIYGNLPVTREELGDFLINRGGYQKLDLLVNKRIIEIEAARRNNITVTPQEIEVALANDILSMNITIKDFTDSILPRYNKTLYEWEEDVIKPRLLLGKMCRDRIKLTEEDIKKAYENKCGERRQAKIIIWKNEKDNLKIAEKQWNEARQSDADYDRIARMQSTPSLAAAGGLIAPIGPYPDVDDETCTKKLYALKVGEMTELFGTPAGFMCMKLVAIIPPDPTVFKFTDQKFAALKAANVPDLVLSKLTALKNKDFSRGDLTGDSFRLITPDEVKQNQLLIFNYAADPTASFEQMRPAFEREIMDKKLTAEIPKFFTDLKKIAEPNLLLKGPPTTANLKEGAEQVIQELQQTGAIQPSPMQRRP